MIASLASTALSNVFCYSPGGYDPIAALKAIAASGFGRVQIPVWYPSPSAIVVGGVIYTLTQIIDEAHGLDLGVDITLHTDGENGAYTQLAFVNPLGYRNWAAAVLKGQPLLPTDTVAYWNELSPLPIGDWAPLATLYSVLGNWMIDVISEAGAVPVCPMPMSQTPRDVYDCFNGMLNVQLLRGHPRYAVHLYKDDITPAWGLDLQFKWLDAACTFLDGAAFEINEFGGTLPGPSLNTSTPGRPVADVAFYLSVAAQCAARGWRHCAWQWPVSSDGLTVGGNVALISGLVGKSKIAAT